MAVVEGERGNGKVGDPAELSLRYGTKRPFERARVFFDSFFVAWTKKEYLTLQ